MLSSGVADGKPGFVGIVPFVGAVVMELAAVTHVPDNINPTTVKPIEVSFKSHSKYLLVNRMTT